MVTIILHFIRRHFSRLSWTMKFQKAACLLYDEAQYFWKFLMEWKASLYRASSGWWNSIGGVQLVFHSLNAIHCITQHASELLQSFVTFLLQLYLVALGACFNIYMKTLHCFTLLKETFWSHPWSYTQIVSLFHSLIRYVFVYTTKIFYNSHDFISFINSVFACPRNRTYS